MNGTMLEHVIDSTLGGARYATGRQQGSQVVAHQRRWLKESIILVFECSECFEITPVKNILITKSHF